jgi:hypothetical protein
MIVERPPLINGGLSTFKNKENEIWFTPNGIVLHRVRTAIREAMAVIKQNCVEVSLPFTIASCPN